MSTLRVAAPQQDPARTATIDFDAAKRAFADNGYVVFPSLLNKQRLTEHTHRLFDAFDKANESGPLFSGGGGMIMGHLNCFPGEETRQFYDALERQGIIDFVRDVWPQATGLPNVGCNFNLPRSSAQNYHVDGYAATAFPVVNIASVDTHLVNGAFDLLERTHLQPYTYWQIVTLRPASRRVCLSQGDVLVRSSMLWHRGMPNRSCRARPMLAFTWEDGGSSLDDPFRKNDGQIAFYTNRYPAHWMGRVRERAYVMAPKLNAAARLALSFAKR